MAAITYLDAIREALIEEMDRDDKVFLLGQDIAVYGGAFKVTKGLLEKFGEMRVLDTPISESLIAGASMGAALVGLRPVAEMQFSDFVSCAFDQLTNMIAKAHYRWGAQIPMVMRLPSGGNVHGGPFHSQNPEAYFFHTPGLKLVAPSTPYDAKGLLKSAIRDNNPVLYFEHKYLYRRIKSELPAGEILVPIGRADIKREGGTISVITYGAMVHTASEAANTLASEGIELEIVDLRSLLPWDQELVCESVKKTGRAIVLHEATLTGGVGAEISAYLSEHCFDYLDAPVARIAAPDTPVPFAPVLEAEFIPNSEWLAKRAREIAAY